MKEDSVIIGAGVVGQAVGKALGIKKFFDKRRVRCNLTFEELKNYKYVFLCLPTPTTTAGCDIRVIENYIRRLGKGHIFIIKSTVIPGTAVRLMKKYDCLIVSNPEFLTESTAVKDAQNPDIIVIGSSKRSIRKNILSRFYKKRKFPKSKMIETDNTTAEMIKYAINTFYVTKVLFAHYLYQICQKPGVDYSLMKKAMYQRKWIGKNHLAVPYKNQFGVRGKCLPKDLIAFAKYSNNPFFKQMVKFMKETKNWQI